MPIQKQSEANLRNAQFSSGPKSPEGKATSAQNSFKHGFCADDATLYDDPETSQQISARVTRYLDHYLPQSPIEEATVTEIAFCEVRLEHLLRAETGLLNFYRQLAFQQHNPPSPSPDREPAAQNRDRQEALPTEKPVLPNEPNFDLTPIPATPLFDPPAPGATPDKEGG